MRSKCKIKKYKISRRNHKRQCHDLELVKDFLDMTPKALSINDNA